MTEKDFWEMMIEERIGMLLKEKGEKREEVWMEEGEKILENLDEDRKEGLRTYIGRMINEMAVTERKIYLGGLRDGFRLAEWMREGGSDLEEMPGIEKALE